MYLFSWRLASTLAEHRRRRGGLEVLAIVVILAHVVPFVSATRRHFQMTNVRQEELIGLAEQLTDPRQDPVYDRIGMVPTRASIHAQWFLHSSNVDGLAARPAAVIIPSYRADWLARDGVSITATAVELKVSTHRIECTADCRPAVVWLGPQLNQLPDLAPRDHRLLFTNWY